MNLRDKDAATCATQMNHWAKLEFFLLFQTGHLTRGVREMWITDFNKVFL